MANTKSAKIANRKSIRRTEINRARKSRIRTFIKKVETAITGGNHADAMKALRVAESEMNSGVTKNIINKNTAARKISRLNARVKALGGQSGTNQPKAKKSA